MNSASRRALAAALVVLPAAVISAVAVSQGFHRVVVVRDSTLPATIGSMSGDPVPLTEGELSILDSPAASQRVYRDPATRDVIQVLLLQVDNTQNAHDPRLCMTGAGYTIAEDKAVSPPWGGALPGQVSRAVFRKGTEDVVMYYWLQTDSHLVPDMSAGLKLTGMLQALRGESVRGVAVRLICLENPTGDDPDKALASLWQKISSQTNVPGIVKSLQ